MIVYMCCEHCDEDNCTQYSPHRYPCFVKECSGAVPVEKEEEMWLP